MLNNQARGKCAINPLLAECIFIVLIRHQEPERLLTIFFRLSWDAMPWLAPRQDANGTNLSERWAHCLIKDYSGSERLTYSQEMLIIFTPKRG